MSWKSEKLSEMKRSFRPQPLCLCLSFVSSQWWHCFHRICSNKSAICTQNSRKQEERVLTMAESRERTKEMTNKQIRQNSANKLTHTLTWRRRNKKNPFCLVLCFVTRVCGKNHWKFRHERKGKERKIKTPFFCGVCGICCRRRRRSNCQ